MLIECVATLERLEWEYYEEIKTKNLETLLIHSSNHYQRRVIVCRSVHLNPTRTLESEQFSVFRV